MYIQALLLSTVKRSQRNTNEKAGETLKSTKEGQKNHRKEERGERTEQMEENDLNLPCNRSLEVLEKVWEVSENNL